VPSGQGQEATIALIRAYDVDMIDASHISDRIASMRQEISELRVTNALYWVKSQRTPLDKSAHALRQGRLLGIKQELAAMMKSCA
jgi:hypothetical protein